MVESPLHKRAKEWVAEVLKRHGCHVEIEKKMHRWLPAEGRRGMSIEWQWTFDLYAEVAAVTLVHGNEIQAVRSTLPPKRKLNIEIDGKVGHGKLRQRRDAVRDAHFKKEGIQVVRFPLRYFVGKKRMSEEELLKELRLAD